MRVLVAPLNWGLGHAARCVPLVNRFLAQGDEVVLGGDGESLILLQKHFPTLQAIRFADLSLSYSAGKSQVGAMLRALPKIVRAAFTDHLLLENLLEMGAFIDRKYNSSLVLLGYYFCVLYKFYKTNSKLLQKVFSMC